MDLIKNYEYNGKISILVDYESRNILERISFGNSDFLNSVKIETIDTLSPEKEFDLYLALASISGEFRFASQIYKGSMPKLNPNNYRIKLATDGVMIAQTVIGNTENMTYNPHAILRYKNTDFPLSPAGLNESDSGVYNDFVAIDLKNKDIMEITKYLLDEIRLISDDFSKEAISQIVSKNRLKGSKIGLAYGISSNDTKIQFESYLKGLIDESDGKSFCVITPSSFSKEQISDVNLKSKIIFIKDLSKIPENGKNGFIYIVQTKTLPHKVFVGLLAYSMKNGVVPVGAGDGFMSAAINLGGAFVLTRVQWNAKNIFNFKNLLIDLVNKHILKLQIRKNIVSMLENIFENIDLRNSQKLKDLSSLYLELSQKIPIITERIIEAATYIKKIPPPEKNSLIADSLLQQSILKYNSVKLKGNLCISLF